MNALVAPLEAGGLALAYWYVARRAALRRARHIGTLPPYALPALACAALLAALAGAHPAAIAALPAVTVAGIVDARTGSIFDPLTFGLLGASLAMCWFDGSLASGMAGTACIGAAMLLLYALTGGRGLGLGDVKLGAAVGMALGLVSGVTAMGLAFIFGGAYGVWLLMRKRAGARSEVRFGPFIAAGTFAALFVPAFVR